MRNKPLTHRIVWQILLYVVLFWIVMSAARLGLLYYRGHERQNQIPETIRTLYMPLISQSVWNIDIPTTEKALATISALNGVIAIELDTRLGQRLRYARPDVQHEASTPYPIDVQLGHGSTDSLGTLTVYVANQTLWHNIVAEILASLLQSVLDFIVLALLVTWAIRKHISQPLHQVIHALRTLRTGQPPLTQGSSQEMDELVATVEQVRQEFNQKASDNRHQQP